MTKTKVLVLLLVLLFALFVGEVVYYFFSATSKTGVVKVYTNTTPSPTQSINKQAVATITGDKVNAITNATRFYINFLLNRSRKSVTTVSNLTNLYHGQIINIVKTNYEAPKGYINKEIIFLRSLTENDTYRLYLTENQISKLKVTSKNKTPLNFSDLKKGDVVTITEKVNLLKSDYFSGIESFTIDVKNR